MSVQDALNAATRHHQAGDLAAADAIYRQILSREPTHMQTLHQVGMLALQQGQFRQAIDWITQALRVDGRRPELLTNLGEAHRRLGELPQAIQYTEQALRIAPQSAGALTNLGLIRRQQGDLASAADAFRQAIKLKAEDARLRLLLGDTLTALRQWTDAEACFRRALRSEPANADAHFLLGNVLVEQSRLVEAMETYGEVLRLNPRHFEAHINLGTIYKTRRQPQEAEAHYRQAIALSPTHAIALSNLGSVLADQGRNEEALGPCLRACELAPNLDVAFYNAGFTLQHLNRFDEAIKAFDRSIQLNPNVAAPHARRAGALQILGRVDEAILGFRRAVELDPANASTHTNLLYALNFVDTFDADDVAREHFRYGQRHADHLTAVAPRPANDRSQNRRIRVGYVSSHFYAHAVNFFVEPIIRAHDRSAVDVVCYSAVSKPDEITQRLAEQVEWRNIVGRNEQEVADWVRRDAIDILVDLAGHIGGAQLGAFARKPSPVQVTYIGYQSTTGMRAMDYRLTDEWSDPPGTTEQHYTEKLVRLPQSFFCYQPSADAPLSPQPPAEANGYITFGSFNNFAKVSPAVLSTWADILNDVPGSHLVALVPDSGNLRQSLLEMFQQRGIAADRLQLVARCARTEYLRWIDQVDIALDPFPFNGHTTTCDTLWTGVPVVTMVGKTYSTRFGASGLVTLGLDELLAYDAGQYRGIAVNLASDIERLRLWRRDLRPRMRDSAICDHAGFARRLEAAYRQMWVNWCKSS